MADEGVKGFTSNVGFGPSDRAEQRPLPLRMVCVGDFAAQAPALLKIDAHDFDAVMARVAPRLFFECADLLGGRNLEVDLSVRGIKGFEPAALAAQLPRLAPLSLFIERAEALQSGTLSPADFKRDLAPFSDIPALRPILDDLLDCIGGAPAAAESPAPAPEKSSALDSAVASIFSMVDTGSKPAGSGAIDAAAASLAGGSRFDVAGPIKSARALMDKQARAIIHHPRFREIEARWRGLHHLCRQGKAAHIELLHAAAGAELDAITEYVAGPDRAGIAEPVALILCDTRFENTPEGNEKLQSLGELGAELQAPVVVSLDAEFLGKQDMAQIANMDAPGTLLDGPAFDKLRSLRGKDAARWLVAACNGFALRQPYKRAKGGIDEALAGEGEILWGSAAWAVAIAVARSQEATGWPSAHTGVSDGEIPGLAVFDVPGREGQFPLQAIMPDAQLKALSRLGLSPLACQANHDSAWLLVAPVLHKPSRAEEEGKLHTLAYAMLAARIGASIMRNRGRLVSGQDTDRTQVNFEQFLDGLLSDTGPGAGASVSIEAGTIRLKLRVGRAILNGVELELAIPTGS